MLTHIRTRSLIVALGLAGLPHLAFGKASTFQVDTEKSVVTWVGQKVAGKHNGTLKIKSGMVQLENDQLKSGEFVLDMNSIDNLDLEGEWKTKLIDHLKSDDFFNVSKYPTGTFKTTNVTPGSKTGEYNVTGDLTIKGIKKPISFPLTMAMDKGVAKAKANLSIDRLKWDIKYNSGKFFDAKKLGDKMIYDEIQVGLDLVANTANNGNKKAKQASATKKQNVKSAKK